jgi:DNA-binding NtrC family response regulator
MKPAVLVIDDEPALFASIADLCEETYKFEHAATGKEALEKLSQIPFALVLLDLRLPDFDGLTVLQRMRGRSIDVPVIVLTGTNAAQTAVRAMKLGAQDYLVKPWDPDELRFAMAREIAAARQARDVEAYKAAAPPAAGFDAIVTRNPTMLQLIDEARRAAAKNINMLLLGPTGTGKDLFARAIHATSPRADRPFIAVNCAAIPPELIESELFGHERGAFTGATRLKRGCFELADGGTLFLDEIVRASRSAQDKMLRVMQDRTFRRVGGEAPLHADVRVIASSNRDVTDEIAAERFSADLYFRIRGIDLRLPALRERPEDIPLLIRHFLQQAIILHGSAVTGITDEALFALCSYEWPGNVRDLEHTIHRMVVLEEGDKVGLDHLPGEIIQAIGQRNGSVSSGSNANGNGLFNLRLEFRQN